MDYFPHPLGVRVRFPPGHGRLSVVRAVCCQKSLLRADHLSREVLSSVVCITKCDNKTSKIRRLCSTRDCCVKNKMAYLTTLYVFEIFWM